MADRAELRRDGEILLVDVHELEEDVRRARVGPHEAIHYSPWTGDGYLPVAQVPALAAARDAPEARFHAHLLARRFPWLTLALVVVLVGLSIVQFAAEWLGGDRVDDLVHLFAVGWEPSILDQAPWGPLTSQFVHANPFHLLGNLVVIGYCGFRCERAMGPAALLAVLAASVAGGAALVIGFSDLPCIGSSIIGFGLWGAQFAIGWRYNDWIPARWRGNYGVGTVVLTIPMLVQSLTSPEVSFLGHLGGWLGGIVAAMAFVLPTAAPKARARAARIAALATAAVVLALPAATCLALGYFPRLTGQPTEIVQSGETGLFLDVPWRLSTNPVRVAGMHGWSASPSAYAPVYATVVEVDHPGLPSDEELTTAWIQRLGGTVEVVPARLEREGWAARGWKGVDGDGTEWEAQEVLRARGWSTARVGYYTETGATSARVRAYQAVVDSARWEDPPELADKEAAYKKWPDDPEFVYRYGYALEQVGRVAEAMAIYALLAVRDDGWEWNAARARMRVCAWEPAVAGCEGSWREEWLARAPPSDQRIWLPAIRWATTAADCASAQAMARRVAIEGDVEFSHVEAALGACAGWVDPAAAAALEEAVPPAPPASPG